MSKELEKEAEELIMSFACEAYSGDLISAEEHEQQVQGSKKCAIKHCELMANHTYDTNFFADNTDYLHYKQLIEVIKGL